VIGFSQRLHLSTVPATASNLPHIDPAQPRRCNLGRDVSLNDLVPVGPAVHNRLHLQQIAMTA